MGQWKAIRPECTPKEAITFPAFTRPVPEKSHRLHTHTHTHTHTLTLTHTCTYTHTDAERDTDTDIDVDIDTDTETDTDRYTHKDADADTRTQLPKHDRVLKSQHYSSKVSCIVICYSDEVQSFDTAI